MAPFNHTVERVTTFVTKVVTENEGSTLHSTDAGSVFHIHLSTRTRELLTAHPVVSLRPLPHDQLSLLLSANTPHNVLPVTLTEPPRPHHNPLKPTKGPKPPHGSSKPTSAPNLQPDPPNSTEAPTPQDAPPLPSNDPSPYLSTDDDFLPHTSSPSETTLVSSTDSNPSPSTSTDSPYSLLSVKFFHTIEPSLPPPPPLPTSSLPHSTRSIETSHTTVLPLPPPTSSPPHSTRPFNLFHTTTLPPPPPPPTNSPPHNTQSSKLSHPSDLLPPPPPAPTSSPHNAPPAPAAKQDPKPPAPVRTPVTTVPHPTHTRGAATAQAPHTPTSTATNVAIGDQESDPTLTASPAHVQSGNVGNKSEKETTIEASTTIVTSGIFTTSLTTVLPNGRTSAVLTTTTGIHTITTTTAVPTQISTISSKSGPSTSTIGGAIGATAIVILGLIMCCILRCKRRHLNKTSQVASGNRLPTSAIRAISGSNTRSRPFLGTSRPREQLAEKRERYQPEYPHLLPRYNRINDQDNDDPFRDPDTIQDQEELVAGARNALDRLQELSREAEEELRELGNRAQRGQLSDSERERLDEIRRTTGLIKAFDLEYGRLSTTSIATSYMSPPPSYHSK